MNLVDSSACIEFFRGIDSAASAAVREAVATATITVTEPIVMELLAGRVNVHQRRATRNFLAGAHVVQVGGMATWEHAAAIYWACASGGSTIRSQIDCLIAAVAIRENIEVLHADRDFDEIAKHTSLRVAPV